jgi:hypothetical protein
MESDQQETSVDAIDVATGEAYPPIDTPESETEVQHGGYEDVQSDPEHQEKQSAVCGTRSYQKLLHRMILLNQSTPKPKKYLGNQQGLCAPECLRIVGWNIS